MILYKYVDFNAVKKILLEDKVTLGFTHPYHLNDPFELTAADMKLSKQPNRYCDPKFRLSRVFWVLSLTRTHLNPIMWSLYAENYKGAVIAIDSDLANLESNSIIKPSDGDVVYTNSFPKCRFELEFDGAVELGTKLEKSFQPQDMSIALHSLIRKAYLNKSLQWSHEEEVRVVKNVLPLIDEGAYSNDAGDWLRNEEKPFMACLQIPKESIKGVYFFRQNDKDDLNSIVDRLRERKFEVYEVREVSGTWGLHDRPWGVGEPLPCFD